MDWFILAQSGPSFKKYFKIVERNNKKKTNSDKNRKIKTKQKMDKEEWMQWALCLLNFCASLFFFFRFFVVLFFYYKKKDSDATGTGKETAQLHPATYMRPPMAFLSQCEAPHRIFPVRCKCLTSWTTQRGVVCSL